MIGASLIIQNQEGETPLLLAELGGHEEVSHVLHQSNFFLSFFFLIPGGDSFKRSNSTSWT